jgi:hypothetical protein
MPVMPKVFYFQSVTIYLLYFDTSTYLHTGGYVGVRAPHVHP